MNKPFSKFSCVTITHKIRLMGRLSLFWRLFLSLLLMLLFTSALSVSIENYLSSKQLKKSMDKQVESLLMTRLQIAEALQLDDFETIKDIYHQDRRLVKQIFVLDEMGNVVFPKHRLNKRNHQNTSQNHETFQNVRNKRKISQLLRQINVTEIDYPELADISVIGDDGQDYIIEIQPRLPLPEIIALRQDYKAVRFGLILLFSLLVCYGFSHTLTKRIRRLQQAVHRISEGSYQSNNDLMALGNDELGSLANDVSRLSNRLKESELARKQMLSDISHELRSPLARLDIATEIARDITPQAGKYLDRIEKESNRMNELIGQIIHIQSLQMQGYAMNTEECMPVQIMQMLMEIKKDVCFEFQHKSVQWQLQNNLANQADNIMVFGNPEQLHSALENIIRNAFIHTKANSTVTIQLQDTLLKNKKIALQIDVMDMGNGIENKQDLQRIFQPFVRLSSSRERVNSHSPKSEKSTGYGLGLAIAHAIIKAHKGQLKADNRNDHDTGLVVSIMIPINFDDNTDG